MSAILNSTVQAVNTTQFTFQAVDYIVFALTLCVSAGIGVYFGFFDKSADTTDEYLMGGKRMKTLPIAISLVASQLSAISIMSIPAEMYAYGINWYFNVVSMLVVIPVLNYVIVPVFYNNNITNCYEYLEMRFNRATRQIQTIIFVLTIFFMLPIWIFMPSLAFAQVTGFNVHTINAIVCGICIFYTMIGGIKAVVWTDVIQAAVMVVSVVLVGVLGAQRLGLSEVLRIADEGGRLDIDYTLDIKTRATMWNTLTAAFIAWSGYVGLNQSCVQRIVSLPSLAHARRSLVFFGLGFFLIISFNCFTGIVMYARYHDCDPLIQGVVSKLDKMVPYLVQDVVGHLSGMPGVFISCVFSAALSTLSASINSLSGIVYFDYIKPRIEHTEHKANIIMKLFVLLTGVYCVLAGFFVERLSSILQIVFSIVGVSYGALTGVFLLGMLIPRAHGRAALIGIVVSLSCMIVILICSWGRNQYPFLPSSVDNCPSLNASLDVTSTLASLINTTTTAATTLDETTFNILDLSFNWYSVLGFILMWLVGVPLSYLLKPAPDANFDAKLLSPIIKPFLNYELAPSRELDELKFIKQKVQ
ncbi:sodium-coupled monocarboxylate transporter 2 [Drosophila busckii]|uniref:sodium-coupled monocarboxylate transporter 2 n=1 Tax=Drosophila busckii TaxID=30019 RepID=UPI00083F4B4A|nr:sodium-coupled monocarboxylate transporter 2 [Drosophila busckii]